MNRATLEKMIRAGKITPVDVVTQAPIDTLDGALTMLKRHRSAKEITAALTERIAKAPLEDFRRLAEIYFKHCGLWR